MGLPVSQAAGHSNPKSHPHHCVPETMRADPMALRDHVDETLGKVRDIASKLPQNCRYWCGLPIFEYGAILRRVVQPVDRMLIARHESNPRSNNHYS
jgi:imidazolonepropionase-like amidohydrolase